MKGKNRPKKEKKHTPNPVMKPMAKPDHNEPCGVCDSFYHCKHCAHSKLSYEYK